MQLEQGWWGEWGEGGLEQGQRARCGGQEHVWLRWYHGRCYGATACPRSGCWRAWLSVLAASSGGLEGSGGPLPSPPPPPCRLRQ